MESHTFRSIIRSRLHSTSQWLPASTQWIVHSMNILKLGSSYSSNDPCHLLWTEWRSAKTSPPQWRIKQHLTPSRHCRGARSFGSRNTRETGFTAELNPLLHEWLLYQDVVWPHPSLQSHTHTHTHTFWSWTLEWTGLFFSVVPMWRALHLEAADCFDTDAFLIYCLTGFVDQWDNPRTITTVKSMKLVRELKEA